jgi:hypothetical protein
MNSIPTFVRWLTVCCALALGLVLAGCEPPAPRVAKDMAVGITGYNFTNEGVQEYYVNDRRGSNLPPYGGGGKTSCCVTLPGQWTPGLTVKVDWTMGHWTTPYETRKHLTIAEQIKCCSIERTLSKTVPVERYDEDGRLQVFFLPNDEIKVWVSNLGLGHERHPSGMAYPKNPVSAE